MAYFRLLPSSNKPKLVPLMCMCIIVYGYYIITHMFAVIHMPLITIILSLLPFLSLSLSLSLWAVINKPLPLPHIHDSLNCSHSCTCALMYIITSGRCPCMDISVCFDHYLLLGVYVRSYDCTIPINFSKCVF